MLDLSFGLPITVRDAALKMIAPGPTSDVNREYYAQEHEREIEEGRGGLEEYEKTDEKARDLLRRLANSEPFYKKRRRLEAETDSPSSALEGPPEPKRLTMEPSNNENTTSAYVSPHASQSLTRKAPAKSSSNRRAFPTTTTLPPQPSDILPPANPKITSLFLTGVEDDQPEHTIRTFFARFGPLRSLVCSHRSHCAFVNYVNRTDAETAAAECQGRAVVAGVPLRVQWGRPKPLDSLEAEERAGHARAGRETEKAIKAAAGASGRSAVANGQSQSGSGTGGSGMTADADLDELAQMARPPPGQDAGDDRALYASLAGD